MNIGEKIKSIRSAKMMTQSELAGDMITRNMLSRIEHGAATPSLQTIQYIASRLNVPAGFLLAEEGDDFLYKKLNSIANIKHAYSSGDWRICRDICESVFGGGQADDEISMILCKCWKEVGGDELRDGHLHAAVRCLDRAYSYSLKTVYDTRVTVAEIKLYFNYMREFSPIFASDTIDEAEMDSGRGLCECDKLCRYIYSLGKIGQGGLTAADDFEAVDGGDDLYVLHVWARAAMAVGDYPTGLDCLKKILRSELIPSYILLYSVICDMEICCRETGDYKGAYENSKDKVGMYEKLLEDT